MLTPGPSGSYGLGLARAHVRRCRVWGHSGFYADWTTIAVTQLQAGVTITVVVRGSHKGAAAQALRPIVRVLRRRHVLPC